LLSVTVDASFHEALRQFDAVAKKNGVPWLVVGATARIILLEKVYGWPAGLGTEDTDFAVQVESWEHYDALCRQFEAAANVEPAQRPTKRFVARDGRRFDLLPYGGVEENYKEVFWPPDRDDVMTVRGFRGAMSDALVVNVNDDVDVPVASPRGLLALKLFAWEERRRQHPGRDAKDIAYLLKHVERVVSLERLYESHADFVEAFDYEIPLAATAVFGLGVSALLDDEEQRFLAQLLDQESREEGDLVAELRRYMDQHDRESAVERLRAFRVGLTKKD
jgi:predicted nucleotidyltransferase